jgi:nucleoid-associated protein YgaU
VIHEPRPRYDAGSEDRERECRRSEREVWMGLFSFVKEAGAKLFGKDEAAEQPMVVAGSPEAAEQRKKLDAARAKRLAAEVEKWGLEVDGLEVTVEMENATVRGTVASQEIREKVILAVGNVAGISQVEDRLEVTGGEATFYTVVRGDTLSKIAQEHYGRASLYRVIFEANRPMLEHPDKIYPGQVLRIPPPEVN